MRRRYEDSFCGIEDQVVRQVFPPRCKLLVNTLQLGREICRACLSAPLGVDACENVAQDDREEAKLSEGGDAERRRTWIAVGLSCVGERSPMFEFFVGVEKFDGYEGIRLLDANRSTLVQTLNLVDDCDDSEH